MLYKKCLKQKMNFYSCFQMDSSYYINIFFNYKALVILCHTNYIYGIIIANYFIKNNKKKGSLK